MRPPLDPPADPSLPWWGWVGYLALVIGFTVWIAWLGYRSWKDRSK